MDTHTIHTCVVQVPVIGLELERDLRRHTLLALLQEKEKMNGDHMMGVATLISKVCIDDDDPALYENDPMLWGSLSSDDWAYTHSIPTDRVIHGSPAQ